MKFTGEITDPDKLAGITHARERYNADLPEQMHEVEVTPADGDTPAVTEQRAIVPKPGTLATDAEYVQYVMDKAAESYAKQYA